MKKTLTQTIGNTPLVALSRINASNCQVVVKLESTNPGGSIKDRIALHMLDKALEEGRLKPGGTIIEPTSGNTGIALAMLAATRGFSCILTMPESMSLERRKLLAAYGAKLILTPAANGMAGAVRRAEKEVASTKDAFMPSQFDNPHAVEAHYKNTGPEIYTALEGRVDALVAGVGTGTTLSGCGLYLREKVSQIGIYAVEPQESPLLSKGESGPHGIQGIGANFIPTVLRRDIITEVITVSTKEALRTARRLMTEEGISAGISSGANVCAALKLAERDHMQGKTIVTFICDGGERYMSTDLFKEAPCPPL